MVCWDDEDDVWEVASVIDEQEGTRHTAEHAELHEAQPHVYEVASTIDDQEGAHHTVEHAELHEAHPQRTSSIAGYISNAFFLFGSILYVCLAVWDYQYAEEGVNDNDGPSLAPDELLEHKTDDDCIGIDFPSFTICITTYTVISATAAAMYIFDAIFQIKELTNSSGSSNSHLLHGLRHTRLFEFSTGLTFGVGAILDFTCTMTVTLDDPWISMYFGVSSSYVYLVSAFLISIGKDSRFDTMADGIESSGDILFITGSILDVLSIYLLAGKDANEVAIGNLIVTSLWLLDAIIYILADLYLFLVGCCCCGGAPAEDNDSEREDDIDDVISVALCSASSDTQLESYYQEDDAQCLDRCSSNTSNTARNDESWTDAEETSTVRSSTPDAPNDLEPEVASVIIHG
jgi:predicted membrane channel-forming protein YqfA (hemolysin III family)